MHPLQGGYEYPSPKVFPYYVTPDRLLIGRYGTQQSNLGVLRHSVHDSNNSITSDPVVDHLSVQFMYKWFKYSLHLFFIYLRNYNQVEKGNVRYTLRGHINYF